MLLLRPSAKKNNMGICLLDTCIWEYWFNPNDKQHIHVLEHVEQLRDDDKLGISIITWGEIFYGYKVNLNDSSSKKNEFLQFIKSKSPKTFYIDIHTAHMYGELRAKLFEKFAPKNNKKGLRPEQLVDPITSLVLGIQENDLWITAQAMARNLILVTNDKLSRIKEVTGSDLRIKNWAN